MYFRIIRGLSRSILFEITKSNIRLQAKQSFCTDKILRKIPELNLESSVRTNHELVELLISKLESIPDNKQWEDLRNTVLNEKSLVNKNNIDAIVVSFCKHKLDLTKSYIKYLKSSKIEPNIATIGKILISYNAHYENKDIPKKEVAAILEWCDKLLKLGTLDVNTASRVIHGLILTPRWKECLKLLDMIKITSKPSIGVYSIIIDAAFKNSEIDIGWKLFDEMVKLEIQPHCSVFETWINYCLRNYKKHKDGKHLQKDLEEMLHAIAANDVRISKHAAMHFVQAFENIGWTGTTSTVLKSGICQSCSKKLAQIKLLVKDFKKLQEVFLKRVLIRKDVFLRTNPVEIEKFHEMLKKTAPYDVVIDGLNVAFGIRNKNPMEMADTLLNVVQYFTDQGKKVLVMGRKHMAKWPQNKLAYIREKAYVFLTEDLSFDDPFVLEAAITSGPKTIIVSRDLMRGHRFLLEDPDLRDIFKKWQLSNQYQVHYVDKSGKVIFVPPSKFIPSAQKNEYGWHIPIVEEFMPNTPYSLDPPDEWICLKPKS